MPAAKVTEVMKYFGIESAAKFAPEWKRLSESDKAELKNGIGDGSENY